MFGQYVIYVDESGDHGPVSKDYPLFVLAFCIFRKDEYAHTVIPAIHNLKFRHLGHDAIVLHEREIRRSEKPFEFLRVPVRRTAFMEDISQLIADAPFRLVAVAVDKRRHPIDDNPYAHALGVGLANVAKFLRSVGEDQLTHVIVEARGKKEDNDLRVAFSTLCEDEGKLSGCNMELHFASKQHNHCGLQLADLIAYPIGRRLLDPPEKANRAYDVIVPKFWRSDEGQHQGWGLHYVPEAAPTDGSEHPPPALPALVVGKVTVDGSESRPQLLASPPREATEKRNAPALESAPGQMPTENAQSQ